MRRCTRPMLQNDCWDYGKPEEWFQVRCTEGVLRISCETSCQYFVGKGGALCGVEHLAQV